MSDVVNPFTVPDDPSEEPCLLYIVLRSGNSIPAGPMSLRRASDHIRNWYNCREHVGYGQGEDKIRAGKWLEDGTLALNWIFKEVQGVDVAQCAFSIKEVVAMYVIPITKTKEPK
jgi:hypothetical protein